MLRPYADSPKCLLVSSRPVSTRLAARVGRFLRRLRRQRRTWHGARGQCGGRPPARPRGGVAPQTAVGGRPPPPPPRGGTGAGPGTPHRPPTPAPPPPPPPSAHTRSPPS